MQKSVAGCCVIASGGAVAAGERRGFGKRGGHGGVVAGMLAIFCWLGLSASLPGATSYTSVGNGPWGDRNTWSPPGPPPAGANVTIGSGHRVTTNPGTLKVGSLTVNGTLEGGYGKDGHLKIDATGDVTVGAGGTIRTPALNPDQPLNKAQPTGNLEINCGNLNNSGTIASGASNVRGAGTGAVTINAKGNVTNAGNASKITSGDDNPSAPRKKPSINRGAPTGAVRVTANGQIRNEGQICSGAGSANGADSGSVSVSGKNGVANAGHVHTGAAGDGDLDNTTGGKQSGGKSGDVSVTSSNGSVANETGATIFTGPGGRGTMAGSGDNAGDGGNSGGLKVRGKQGVNNQGDITSGDGGAGGDGVLSQPGAPGKGGNSGAVSVHGDSVGNTVATGVRTKSGNGGRGGDAPRAGQNGGDGGNSGGVVVGGTDSTGRAKTITGAERVWTGQKGEGGRAIHPTTPGADGASGDKGKVQMFAMQMICMGPGEGSGGTCDIGVAGWMDFADAMSGQINAETRIDIRAEGIIDLRGIPAGTNAIQSTAGPIVLHVESASQIWLDTGVSLAQITEPDASIVIESVLVPTGLRAVPLGRSQILLEWWDLAGIGLGYRVERQLPDLSWSTLGFTVAGAPPVFVDGGLPPGQTNSYRVSAVVPPPIGGFTAASNVATAATDGSYAQWLAAHGVGDDTDNSDGDDLVAMAEHCLGLDPTVADAWSWLTFAMTYQETSRLLSVVCHRAPGHDETPLVIEANPAGDLSSWIVAAVEPDNGGAPIFLDMDCTGLVRNFTRVKFTTAEPALLPIGFAVRSGAITPYSITLDWLAGTMPATTYRVRRSEDGGEFTCVGEVVVAPGQTVFEFTDPTCLPESRYLYNLHAIGSTNAAPFSATVWAATPAAPP